MFTRHNTQLSDRYLNGEEKKVLWHLPQADLNRDGFNDFAVGSPYEDNGGAVYIFFGGLRGVSTANPNDAFLKAELAAEQVSVL